VENPHNRYLAAVFTAKPFSRVAEGNVQEASLVENQESKAVPPFEAALVIIVTFFLSAFLGAAILLTLGYGPAGVIGELLILIIPLIYLLTKRINIKSYIGINLKPKFILLGLASGAILFLLNIVVSTVLTNILGTSQAVEQVNMDLVNTSSTTIGLVMVTASLALAGVCEEFAFRGFLQNALTRRYSFLPAVLVSAAVFGIFHFDPQGVYTLSAFISGLVLGYIYHRWNSYVVSATAHSTMNLIVIALLLMGL
jgi:membrane protease YdiL (CAAX protease family)